MVRPPAFLVHGCSPLYLSRHLSCPRLRHQNQTCHSRLRQRPATRQQSGQAEFGFFSFIYGLMLNRHHTPSVAATTAVSLVRALRSLSYSRKSSGRGGPVDVEYARPSVALTCDDNVERASTRRRHARLQTHVPQDSHQIPSCRPLERDRSPVPHPAPDSRGCFPIANFVRSACPVFENF